MSTDAPVPPSSTLPGGADVRSLTYEQSRAALETVVRALESGEASLEESLALWERGEELAQRCRTLLEGVRARVAGAADEETGEPERA